MAEPQPAQPPPEQIGVVYTPSTDPRLEPSTTEFINRYLHPACSGPTFDFVRIQWVDLINNIRYRVVTNAYFEKLLDSSTRPGVSIAKCALGLVFLSLADGFGPIGEYIYVLDLSSFRMCGYQPRHHQENRISVAGRDGVAKRGQGDGSGATLSSFDLRRN